MGRKINTKGKLYSDECRDGRKMHTDCATKGCKCSCHWYYRQFERIKKDLSTSL